MAYTEIPVPSIKIPHMVNVYNATNSQYSALVDAVGSLDITTTLQSQLLGGTQPWDGVQRVIQIPHEFNISFTQVNIFRSGVWSIFKDDGTTIIGEILKSSPRFYRYSLGSIDVPRIHNNYLDYTNTDIYIYLPFVGRVMLPIDVQGRKLTAFYFIDSCTGKGICHLHSYGTTESDPYDAIISSYECDFSNEVPFNVYNGSVGMGLANMFLSTQSYVPTVTNPSMISSTGGLTSSGIMSNMHAYVDIITTPEPTNDSNRGAIIGKPINSVTTLNTYTGYIETENVKLASTTATDVEKNEIISLLNSGVYVDSWS